MGTKEGSIIATIITSHMPRNDAAALGQACPGVRIHAIDILQPPGIGISPIADMDVHQWMVAAALAAKSSAEVPKKTGSESRPESTRVDLWPRIGSSTSATYARANKMIASCRCDAACVDHGSGGAPLLGRASNGNHCGCVKPKEDRD